MLPETRRILLADDDSDTLLALKDRLESFGFQVTAVSNGRDAVQEMARGRYDLIIMDVTMPEVDGMEALHMIRLMKPKIPIIIISSSRENALASLAKGAQAYLLKPIDLERLQEAVNRWLREDV